MIIETVKKLNNLISLKPASDKDIKNIEKALSLSLAKEYKCYLKEFGAILADNIELSGFCKSDTRNVVELTKSEWELNNLIPHNYYVIQNLGIDGIIIWQDDSGKIYQSGPGQKPTYIFNSLEDYIKSIM